MAGNLNICAWIEKKAKLFPSFLRCQSAYSNLGNQKVKMKNAIKNGNKYPKMQLKILLIFSVIIYAELMWKYIFVFKFSENFKVS